MYYSSNVYRKIVVLELFFTLALGNHITCVCVFFFEKPRYEFRIPITRITDAKLPLWQTATSSSLMSW